MSGETAPGPVHVLLSGGMDSMACVEFYRTEGRDVEGLFIDYGQAAAVQEARAARRIADHYGIALRTLALSGVQPSGAGLIHGRNGFLIFAALLDIGARGGTIVIGLHAGTTYYDCSGAFIDEMRRALAANSGGTVGLAAPFADRLKSQIFDHARHRGLPLHLTYSCERGTDPPCGDCLSCNDIRIDRMVRERNARAAAAASAP